MWHVTEEEGVGRLEEDGGDGGWKGEVERRQLLEVLIGAWARAPGQGDDPRRLCCGRACGEHQETEQGSMGGVRVGRRRLLLECRGATSH